MGNNLCSCVSAESDEKPNTITHPIYATGVGPFIKIQNPIEIDILAMLERNKKHRKIQR